MVVEIYAFLIMTYVADEYVGATQVLRLRLTPAQRGWEGGWGNPAETVRLTDSVPAILVPRSMHPSAEKARPDFLHGSVQERADKNFEKAINLQDANKVKSEMEESFSLIE